MQNLAYFKLSSKPEIPQIRLLSGKFNQEHLNIIHQSTFNEFLLRRKKKKRKEKKKVRGNEFIVPAGVLTPLSFFPLFTTLHK